MRPIDADELYELIDGGYDINFDETPEAKREHLRMIDYQETVDAVPVVRCKDCKYHENERIDMVYCPAVLGVGSWVENDWFCKDGERREDGD